MVVALVRGLLYLGLTPLWQAPDEPGHFEYAWLLGRAGVVAWLDPARLPPELQTQIQSQIIQSLDRHDFWARTRQARPALLPTTFDQNPFLARSGTQVGKSPLYYLVPALITHLSGLGLDTQVYLMRSYSLLLWLTAVGLAWAGAQRLFAGPVLPVAVASLFALAPMPTFIDVSLNSDALANLMALAAYIAGIYLLTEKGSHTKPVFAGLLALLLALASKRTNLFLLPTAGIVVWILVRQAGPAWRQRIAWGTALTGIATLLIGTALLFWRGPQAEDWWINEPLRPAERSAIAHSGHYALRLVDDSREARPLLTQALPETAIPDLRGQTLQISAWLRTAQGSARACLQVYDGRVPGVTCTLLTERWQQVAVTYTVPDDTERLRVLIGLGDLKDTRPTGELLVDDVMMIDTSGRNLLTNSNAEAGRRRWLDTLEHLTLAVDPWRVLGLHLTDPASYTFERWQTYILYLFLTFAGFWGNFGWLQLPLNVGVYALLALVCTLSVAGLRRPIAWRAPTLTAGSKRVLWIMGWSLIFLTVQTFLPMIAPASDPVRWQPQGRYLFPGLLPVTIFLWLGLSAWWIGKPRPILLQGWLAGLLLLDAIALLTVIWPAYH